jgi:hypothetical protein
MPYAVHKSGSSWVVVKKSDGKVMGTHPTKEKAQDQLAALYANDPGAKSAGGYEVRELTIRRPCMARRYRFFELDKAGIDEKNRTVPIAFSSETPVMRTDKQLGDYLEVLSHDPAHVDLGRLRESAPFLLNHDPNRQIGVVEQAEVGADKVGRAVVRFGTSQLAEEIFKDVLGGIRKHVSVGYEPGDIVADTKAQDGTRTLACKWMPYEISSVPIPADRKTGVGRAFTPRRTRRTRSLMNDECVSYCQSAEAHMVTLLEQMGKEGDPTDTAAVSVLKEAIAAVSVAVHGLYYWSEKTAAECVELCKETAAVLEKASGIVEAGDMDEAVCGCALDAMEEAAGSLYENAGGKPAEEPAATTQERKLDNLPKVNATPETKTGTEDNMKRTLLDAAPATREGGGGTQTLEDMRNAENTRIREITATADLLIADHPAAADKFRAKKTEAIGSGLSVRDFKANMLAEIPGAKPAKPITMASLGASEREIKCYSVTRAIQSCLLRKTNVPDGLEGELHTEMSKRNISAEAGGFWVPPDAMISKRMNRRQQRDLNVSQFGQGGATVQTSILTPIIEILRNRMVCDRLGVQGMAGLEGNVAIPRQTGAATAYSLPEQSTLTKSTQALDQILLTPRRVGAFNNYSRQLLLQSSVDVENFLREDLMKVLALKWDSLILQGQGGGSEPTGILNTTGIGALMFGGTATWAQVIAFETALSLANADLGNMAYVTTPGVRGRWKAVAKTGVGVTSVVPIFLWEKGAWADGSNDGEVNGYRAAATNQIANNLVFFGNWEDVIHALWGGYDVIVDPYTNATDATTRITVNTFGDVAVRHAASFCVSMDAGNQ